MNNFQIISTMYGKKEESKGGMEGEKTFFSLAIFSYIDFFIFFSKKKRNRIKQ